MPSHWYTDSTFGLKISGGVKCNNCSCLHAIVIEISPNLYGNEDIKEGEAIVIISNSNQVVHNLNKYVKINTE